MWISTLAEAASNAPTPDAPPQVPYEFFGVLASALIAGITAVIVAILQRTKRSTEAAPRQGGGPFMVSEADWNTVRDRSVTTQGAVEMLDRTLRGHMGDSDEAMSKIREDIANIKGQLGIR